MGALIQARVFKISTAKSGIIIPHMGELRARPDSFILLSRCIHMT
jgi:hypothetical protein